MAKKKHPLTQISSAKREHPFDKDGWDCERFDVVERHHIDLIAKLMKEDRLFDLNNLSYALSKVQKKIGLVRETRGHMKSITGYDLPIEFYDKLFNWLINRGIVKIYG
jgi:hypothetical protein